MTELFEEDPEDIKVFHEFEEDKKKFLDRNIGRFYKAYRSTGSEKLHRIYQQLLKERQRC